MKILIIEDEMPNARELMSQIRIVMPNADIVGPLMTVAEVRAHFDAGEVYDVVFSDIRLGDGLVFSALEQNVSPVVFTTAYDEYAIRSFEYNAIAYLLKPLAVEKILPAIQKATRLHLNADQMTKLIGDRTPQYRERFLIPCGDCFEVVAVDDISYILLEGRNAVMMLNDKRKMTTSYTLDELEHQLNPLQFFRADRQHIVNIAKIHRLHNWFGGKLRIQVDGFADVRIELSRQRASELKKLLDA